MRKNYANIHKMRVCTRFLQICIRFKQLSEDLCKYTQRIIRKLSFRRIRGIKIRCPSAQLRYIYRMKKVKYVNLLNRKVLRISNERDERRQTIDNEKSENKSTDKNLEENPYS